MSSSTTKTTAIITPHLTLEPLTKYPLSGKHVVLRAPLSSDASTLHATYLSDPECARFLKRPPSVDLAQTHLLIERLGSALHASGENPFAWVIARRDDDVPIGMVTCIPEGASVEIHYGLAKENWGLGFATEAVRLACDELFRTQRFDRIFTTCAAEHRPSRAVLQKSGFEPEAYLSGALVLPALGTDPKDGVRYARYRASREAPPIQFPLPVSG